MGNKINISPEFYTKYRSKALQTSVGSCCNIQILNHFRIGLLMPLMIMTFLLYYLSPGIVLSREMSDLTELDLEDLMNIEITSVSKKPQRLSDAAAAIFVITGDDIRRSGVTNIPEALRMAPGLQVARMDANKWAITSRGFNGRYATKLLVLIDGRSVYTPLFSGVYWDIQDTLMEDIDRIEVIRGPGAALWGANAVNGVINIITKHTKDTQDGLVTATAGTEERGHVAIRYGGRRGDDTSYRVYAKYFNREDAVYASGDDAADECSALRAGFRLDRQISDFDTLMLTGNMYDGRSGERASLSVPVQRTVNTEAEINGINLLGRWEHKVSAASNIMLQLYYDRTERQDVSLDEIRDILDLEFNHQFSIGEHHRIIWGFGYRFTRDNLDNTLSISFTPDRRSDDLYSAFIQDDIWLVKDRLRLRIGSKFEHNDYTGFEIQPNARLILTPGGDYSVWASVSRAVRTPSRVGHGASVTTPLPPSAGVPGNSVTVIGNDNFNSEKLMAYEMGYRLHATEQLSLDAALFYNDYDEAISYEILIPPWPGPYTLLIDNKLKGHLYGAELAANFQVLEWWRLQSSYTYLQMQLHLDRDSTDQTSELTEGENPHHQFSIRSSMNMKKDLDLDLWARYVDSLPTQGMSSYVTLDVRLAWRPHKDLELSIVGQNLLDSQHPEFQSFLDYTFSTEVERSVYGKITWHF